MKLKERIGALYKNKELRDYIIWGVVSAFVNIGTFQFLILIGIEYKVANVIALIVNRVFCYIVNKKLVFKTICDSKKALLIEILSFFGARMVTFLLDYFGLILLVEVIGVNKLIGKVIVAIAVIISNYILSKFFVFRKSTNNS